MSLYIVPISIPTGQASEGDGWGHGPRGLPRADQSRGYHGAQHKGQYTQHGHYHTLRFLDDYSCHRLAFV